MVFIFFGQIPRSAITGSYSMSMFSFVKSCQTILHSGCTILIPIRNEKVLVLLHILSEFGGVIVMDFGHPKRCIVYTFSRSAKVFYTTAEPFYILTNSVQGVIFLCILINTCFLCFKVIPVSVNQDLILFVLRSLEDHDAEHFSCICWPFMCLLWKRVYLSPL